MAGSAAASSQHVTSASTEEIGVNEGSFMIDTLNVSLTSSAEEHLSTVAEYDFVVLGTGEAAKYIAWTLAKEALAA